jgi:multiple sugar transport system permease protein/raffinose/stachyose/melibiose transport system permease protein
MRSFARTYPAYIALSLYSLLLLIPLFWMVMASVKPRRELFGKPFSLPSHLDWGGYQRALAGGLFQYMTNSIIVTVLTVAITLVVGGLAAYALARMTFIGRTFIYGVIIASYAIPMHGILVPLYDTLVFFKLTNTYFGMILPYVTFGLPFSVMILYAFLIDFPNEIVEAARIDGCKDLGVFWRIVVPLSFPAIASVAIFQGVSVWNEFLLALIVVSDDSYKTIPLGLVAFKGRYVTDWTAILASITITSLPMLILFVAFQKQFIRSLGGYGK